MSSFYNKDNSYTFNSVTRDNFFLKKAKDKLVEENCQRGAGRYKIKYQLTEKAGRVANLNLHIYKPPASLNKQRKLKND